MRNQNIYLIDDDNAVIKSLKYMIEENDLGTVIGYSNDPIIAVKDIDTIIPDIVIIDYLMPKMDGPTLISKISNKDKDISFIMFSKISDKEMIAEAYSKGIEYYIKKPLNFVELKHILNNVYEKRRMKEKLYKIQQMFNDNSLFESHKNNNRMKNIEKTLRILGISGKSGYKDIYTLLSHIIKKNIDIYNIELKEIYKDFDEDYKTSVQRIRRSAASGLRNISYLGIEDNLNEYFVKYSNSIFGFENVKYEMDYIRGSRLKGGKINVKDFLINILNISEEK